MRLIDKDRLLKGSNHYWLEMENFGDIESIDVRFVEMAEEVKAIPVEWLNKRAEEIAFAYWTNARNKMTLPLNELPLLIDQIIGEWEKENGRSE